MTNKQMSQEQREETWMNIDETTTGGESQITIQNFLDGEWNCTTGNPFDEDNPQRDISFGEFLEILVNEYKLKNQ